MVDLAKIRKKAKKRVGADVPVRPAAGETPAATPGETPAATPGETPAATPGETPVPTPPPSPEQKLARFVAEAGRPRFAAQAAPAAAPDEVELLTFVLGSERYAIEIEHIVQIISSRPATPIPNAPELVRGIISLRGAIVTLMDVRSRLHQPPRGSESDPRIIVMQEAGGLVGFEVDRVLRPAKVDRASIEPQPVVVATEESEAIRGVIRGDDALTIVLDLSKLLE